MRWIFFSLVFLNIAFAGWQGFLWFDQSTKPVKSEAVSNQQTDVPGIVRLLDEDKDSARLKPKAAKQNSKAAVKDSDQAAFEGDGKAAIREASITLVGTSAKELDGCPAFGPFGDVNESEKLINYFEAKGIASHLFEHKSVEGPSLWLYVRPQSSQEAAQKLVATLRELQIKSSVIKEGDLLNGLSLGFFDNNDEIEVLTARLSALDMEVNKIDKSKSYIEYWVVLRPEEGGTVNEMLLNDVASTFPRSQRSEKVCKAVAS